MPHHEHQPKDKEKLDINYQAFLKDSKELETQFPGHLVAYADGIRVAVGKDARDLLSNIPEEYQKRSLFIKDVPDNIIEIHEPFEFRRSKGKNRGGEA